VRAGRRLLAQAHSDAHIKQSAKSVVGGKVNENSRGSADRRREQAPKRQAPRVTRAALEAGERSDWALEKLHWTKRAGYTRGGIMSYVLAAPPGFIFIVPQQRQASARDSSCHKPQQGREWRTLL
jgi:hypothetical protein